MKKTGLLLLFSLLSFNAFSQVKFSLRVSPAIATTRVTDSDTDDGVEVSRNGAGLGFVGGAALDFFITDNLAFNTGLNYVSTQLNPKVADYTYKYNLQYLQAPFTLKAFTNEIATDMQLYFQVGGTFNVLVSEKLKSTSAPVKDDKKVMSPIDAGIYLGAGVIYKIGESNALFGGFYYNRGLTNIIQNEDSKKVLKARTDLLGLEVGLRF